MGVPVSLARACEFSLRSCLFARRIRGTRGGWRGWPGGRWHGGGGCMPQGIQEPAGGVSRMVPAPGGRLHVTEYPGEAPPLVLMHGFPDDSRIYDRLVPLLAPRHVLAFDWLGYGGSDRASPGPSGGVNHQQQLRAVLDSLRLGPVALVGHDASGPDAIDFAAS